MLADADCPFSHVERGFRGVDLTLRFSEQGGASSDMGGYGFKVQDIARAV